MKVLIIGITGFAGTMKNFAKRVIKKLLNAIGFDVMRLNKSPQYSLLGLRALPIKTIIDVGANTGQFARMIERIFYG
ncbi:MAG: hypothetical protein Q8K51_15875, partial [Nitrospirota bacterium]|nr:hypothetical protein [Nitrospirota bacterium]